MNSIFRTSQYFNDHFNSTPSVFAAQSQQHALVVCSQFTVEIVGYKLHLLVTTHKPWGKACVWELQKVQHLTWYVWWTFVWPSPDAQALWGHWDVKPGTSNWCITKCFWHVTLVFNCYVTQVPQGISCWSRMCTRCNTSTECAQVCGTFKPRVV